VVAVLRGEEREVVLPDRCLVGRSRGCDLVLAGRDVSGEHAVLQWTGVHWELRDLGSRNGTRVGAARLAAGARVALSAGDELRFGRESSRWTLVDAGAPQLMAVSLAGAGCRVAEGGYLALPNAEAPELVVYQDASGRWSAERAGVASELEDRATIDAGGPWRVHLPTQIGGTWEDDAAPVLVGQVRLCFTVSRDEETVELVAWAGERRFDLQARAHHYALLLLARRRLADRSSGAAEPEQGWMRQDELLAMLKIGEDHLSITIHRARTQLGKAGVADAAALIARRPGTRLLRLGVAAIEIVTASA
jgi:hypothetical protein